MKSVNKKVNRTLSTIALIVKDLPDSKIQEIHDAINDNRDGYDYNFKQAVEHYKAFVQGQ
jgi:hypothetical protein